MSQCPKRVLNSNLDGCIIHTSYSIGQITSSWFLQKAQKQCQYYLPLSGALAAIEGSVMEKLFVYGTLCPNCPNEHVLTVIGGSWEAATITGTLRAEGWGT